MSGSSKVLFQNFFFITDKYAKDLFNASTLDIIIKMMEGFRGINIQISGCKIIAKLVMGKCL